jgi:hypothetical protein
MLAEAVESITMEMPIEKREEETTEPENGSSKRDWDAHYSDLVAFQSTNKRVLAILN